jgi:hypothetical protein
MIIYASETDDGLAEVLSSKASICYASVVEKSDHQEILSKDIDVKALAGLSDFDLYYTQSILVTTSWNKNDDIFDKVEVWKARSTPTHKPTNLEHNEQIIVGHITSNYPMTTDGVLIDENTPINNLPNIFHILTGSVIYTGYTEPSLKERAYNLIKEIEEGKKYVSMECFFRSFDYGLIDKNNGSFQQIPRSEETAFLTKYLRAYGGVGEYQNHKIGRILRKISFTGKGFVDKPANPDSIIFTKDDINFDKKVALIELSSEKKIDFEKNSVFSNQANLKENQMSLENEVVELKQKVEAMNECSSKLEEANATISSLQQQVQDFEAQAMKKKMVEEEETALKKKMAEEESHKMKAEYDEKIASLEAAQVSSAAEYDLKIQELSNSLEEIKKELSLANDTVAAYKNKEEEMMKKEKHMKRMAALIENGLDQESASSNVEKFESLDDEAFANIVSLLSVVKSSDNITKASEVEETSDTVEEVKAEDVSEVLDNVEAEEQIDLSVGSDVDAEANSTRAALVDFVCTRLGKKLNKGE